MNESAIPNSGSPWLKAIIIALIVILAALGSGCAGVRIAGKFTTPYGSISSDGKTVTLEANAGFAK